MTTLVAEIPDYVAGTWKIDPIHSYVGFVVKHLMVCNVRGHFTSFEGEIVTADGDPLASSVTVSVDLASVDTSNEQRDAHLRSADFFDAGTHPAMTYRSTGVRRAGDDYVLDGDLTLKGVTRPVPLDLEVTGFGPDPFASGGTGSRAGFSATGELDRMDFGVDFGASAPGGGMVGHKVKIVLEIEAALDTSATSG